jgi:pimeloyl-ACP methyl ester carboxylesterase
VLSTDTEPARPLYLDVAPDAAFALFHPASGSAGVLMLPPFGWDEICSHRARRTWAERVAAAGHPVLRVDFPGAGDSGGDPRDPARLEAWTAAASAAAAWLRTDGGCAQVTACGIGLGGLIAVRAAANGAPIEQLVLWATPARGKSWLRELRAFSKMEQEQFAAGGAQPPPPPEGTVSSGGFVLYPDAIAELEQLDLTTLPLPGITRALLLERDGIAADKRLREHLERAGAEVTVAPGPGYADMLAEPHDARAPTETIDAVTAWLHSGPAPPVANAAATNSSARDAIEIASVREEPITIPQPFGRIFGIVAEPAGERASFSAVFLNAGAIRRIGPGRLWVEAARRWAARGIPSARLDLEGIGDADGDGERFGKVIEFYTPEMASQVRAGLDTLEQRGLAPPYVLTGLCSGAYWAFHAALDDDRVAAAVMLNPRILSWDSYRLARREAKRAKKVGDTAKLMEIVRGEKPLSLVASIAWAAVTTPIRTLLRIPGRLLARARARRAGGDELDLMLDRLRDTDKRVILAFSAEEPLYEEMEQEGHIGRLARWPNVSLEVFDVPDHTLRPPVLQERAHAVIDRAFEEQLAKSPDQRPA